MKAVIKQNHKKVIELLTFFCDALQQQGIGNNRTNLCRFIELKFCEKNFRPYRVGRSCEQELTLIT